ncbi:hypothetical protein CRUP_006530, partial [Coryphaenoides rupestris]
GKLWWANEESAQLVLGNNRDGRNLVVLRNKTSGVVHIKVYDREGQQGRNLCQVNNGGCSQLCFPTSENSRSCSCTVGYNLRTDRMSCEGVDSFLMYSIHKGIRGIALDPNDNTEALMPITGTQFAVAVDFHADVGSVEGLAYHRALDMLYWTSSTNSTISRKAVDPIRAATFSRQVVVTLSEEDHPHALVLDECQ